MLLGLRTVIYPAPNITGAKEWYNQALGIEPYFDEDFYVGYNVAGYELALAHISSWTYQLFQMGVSSNGN